jgi:ESCRT-II complex subunit VPS25
VLYTVIMGSLPEYYSYPPFWTLQRNNPRTLEQQFRLWDAFITSLTRRTKKDTLKVLDALETALFFNKKINRRLSEIDAREIIEFMIRQGHAEWLNDGHTQVRIIWRTLPEWFAIFEDWVAREHCYNQVLTIHEILEDYAAEEFHHQDPQLIVNVFKQAEAGGKKVKFMERPVAEECAVKFLT